MKNKLCIILTILIFTITFSSSFKLSADTTNKSTTPKVQHNITADGLTTDWDGLSPVAVGDKSNKKLYAYLDKTSVNLLVIGENLDKKVSDFYIDIDNSMDTGYHPSVWTNGGADFLVENSTLYKYVGSTSNWSWQPICDVTVNKTSNNIEVKILVSQLGLRAFRQNVNVAYALWYDKEFLPKENSTLVPCQFDYVWTPLESVINYFVDRYSGVFGT